MHKALERDPKLRLSVIAKRLNALGADLQESEIKDGTADAVINRLLDAIVTVLEAHAAQKG
jgi:hypothetical protein